MSLSVRAVRKRWGKLAVSLRPALLEAYRCVYVNVFSVASALSDREELFRSFSQFPGRAVFVVDAWHESQLPLARHYVELCRKWLIYCVLSEHRPATTYSTCSTLGVTGETPVRCIRIDRGGASQRRRGGGLEKAGGLEI